MNHDAYSDAYIRSILTSVKTIALMTPMRIRIRITAQPLASTEYMTWSRYSVLLPPRCLCSSSP